MSNLGASSAGPTRRLQRVDPGLWLSLLPALFVILPLLHSGLPGTADTPIHFYRTLAFERSWGPGVLYPRWAPELAYGYGLPLWLFAPPLPYVITLLLHATGLCLEASLKGLVILSTLGYGLGAYLFVRDVLGGRAGQIAAAVYTLAPFALREVLLYGGNYPQYLAIGLFPWLLWAIGRVYRQANGLNVFLAAILYAAIILSHLFHALVISPVAVFYALALWWGDDRRETVSRWHNLGLTAISMLLGLLVTCFFWLPALVERQFTRAVEDVYVSVSPFSLRFLSPGELLAGYVPPDAGSANPWVPLSLGLLGLVLGVAGLAALLLPGRSRAQRLLGVFFLVLLGGCVFLMLPVSHWVWLEAPFLAVGEFPWRLLGLANLCLAFLAGATACLLAPCPERAGPALDSSVTPGREDDGRKPTRALLTVFSLLVVAALILGAMVYLYPFRPFVHYAATPSGMAAYELATRAIGTTTLGEYLPQWVKEVPTTSPMALALAGGQDVIKIDNSSLPEGATAGQLSLTPARQEYSIHSPLPFEARFLTFYFPGWTAFIDGRAVDIVIEPESGLITIPLPSGSHQVRLDFEDTPLRRLSNVLSGLAVVALLVLLVGYLWRRTTKRSPSTPSAVSGWSWQAAWPVGLALIGLLAAKTLLIDPHTHWFRQSSPPGQVIGVQYPTDTGFDDSIRLLGYDLSLGASPGQPLQVAAGETIQVVLYWLAEEPTTTNYRTFVHLDAPADLRTWAASDHFHPGDATAQIELPTSTWDTTHYVRDEHYLFIPDETPPVEFYLRAGLYDPETGHRLPLAGDETGDTVYLQTIQVTPGRPLRQRDVPNPLHYRLGSDVRLVGYDWRKDEWSLILYWQTDKTSGSDPTVFVHLLDGSGQLAWGDDSPPLRGLFPVSAWQPGTIVADPRVINSAGLPPGEYRLETGMYDPATYARLPVYDRNGQPVTGDSIRLFTLTVP